MARRILCAVILCVASLSAAGDSCVPGFATAEKLISTNAWSAAYGDFNEDGRVDIALLTFYDQLAILLNRGGAYEVASRTSLPPIGSTSFTSILSAADDVNGDGHLDLVFYFSSNAYVALGHGTGAFDKVIRSDIEFAPDFRYIDVDGDGHKDLVGFFNGRATISRASGDGKFVSGTPMNVVDANQDYQFLAGDFDGDGHVDLYAAGYSFLTSKYSQIFWWNDGHGSFVTKTVLTSPSTPSLAPLLDAYDFDGDGADDILFRDSATALMRVKGRVIATQPIEISNAPRNDPSTLQGTGDFDGDGKRDALFSDGTVVWGPGSATRIEADRFDLITSNSISFALNRGTQLADVNGDGVTDLVGTGGAGGLYAVFGQKGSRALRGGSLTTPFGPSRLVMGDLNEDGILDTVGPTQFTVPTIAIAFGDGHGHYVAQPSLAFNGIELPIALADLDGDGHLDIVNGNTPKVVFGNGAGGFSAPISIDGTYIGTGRTDSGAAALFVTANGNMQQVTFGTDRKPVTTVLFTVTPNQAFTVADIDANGPSGFILSISGTQVVLKKSSSGWTVILALPGAYVTSADFNGDTRPDLVSCNGAGCSISFNTGSGFADAVPATLQFHKSEDSPVVAADVDGDGLREAMAIDATNFGDASLVVLNRNLGNGQFVLAGGADIGSGRAFAVTDADGDGRNDLVVATQSGIEVLRGGCAAPRIHAAVTPAQPVAGGSARIVVNIAASDAIFPGGITVREGSKVLGTKQPGAIDYGTATFDLSSLAAGRHTFVIAYEDSALGHFEETLTVDVATVTPRRHNVRH